ncbi:alpha/beta fold hydrolase [Salipaludibacillus aurantiacus]|uniref:Alpha/beta hydrolase fold n=1 Tax=Salipaludibacillus aurantiacus TaxID=1601833 RepID=A0A1H9WY47_9BACI|nr:alpha/beta fold hydrolase [Salipaludibacillus aurantiacus]SES38836.1 alpha/beta hydrolase fold [Salipaludibacillus aurantiacus]
MHKPFIKGGLGFLLLFSIIFSTHHGMTFAGLGGGGSGGEPGTILYGETPSETSEDKPVIVFVQGLTNSSSMWYEGNDMYDMAHQAGYETAFVELYDSAGTPESYWDNGEMLAGQLETISAHYGGKKLAVVGYSKGGIDTQTALVHYGKHDLVSELITIGSPHHGSELADLAYSTWTWWLASLLGSRNAGTESLQTGNMNYFRSVTDGRPEIEENSYYTLAGDDTGPWFSSTWWGGTMIPGPSDGVVSVESAHLPYAPMLAVGNWTHNNIRQGHQTFNVFKNVLTVGEEGAFSADTETAATAEGSSAESSNMIVRGGEQTGEAEESFFVEKEADKITLHWLSGKELTEVTVREPGSGSVRTVAVEGQKDDLFFEGAWHHTVEIEEPSAGEWTFSTETEGVSAYTAVLLFESPLNNEVRVTKDGPRGWQVAAEAVSKRGARPGTGRGAKVVYDVEFHPGDVKSRGGIGRNMRQQRLHNRQQAQNGKVTLPDRGNGTYNATIDIEGTTPSGEKFERTVIRSVYIDEDGNAY